MLLIMAMTSICFQFLIGGRLEKMNSYKGRKGYSLIISSFSVRYENEEGEV